jgi:hypothetical protein
MKFPRKESRPQAPIPYMNPCGSVTEHRFRAGRRVPARVGHGVLRACARRGGKAPIGIRALARPLPFIPLLTLLILSFHMLTSPAMAAGEVAPSFAWPARGEVTAPFRPPHGPYGAGGHAGIDISLPPGSEVRASAQGTVSFCGGTPLGLCVSVMHKAGFKTTYVSLESCVVRRGQKVERGQLVGKSDGTKDRSSSLPHLHFGLFLNGQAIDPLPMLQGRLLDPGDCLFLGPWEDEGAVDAYFERHGQGGFLDWLGKGFKSVGGALKGAAKAVGKVAATAWKWTCRAAGYVGHLFQGFYRHCLEPWVSPLAEGVASAARWLWSNRFVQALVAGIAAAAIICLAVVGVALALGASLVTTVVAAVVGAVAAIGYALYYAFASGDSFSFATCFLTSLAVGGAAAASSLLLSYMAPLIGAGWSQLGWMGLAKSFLVNGGVDSVAYIVFCLATGREVSPWGVLASLVIGGLMGGLGKLFTSGLLAGGTTQAMARVPRGLEFISRRWPPVWPIRPPTYSSAPARDFWRTWS